ncbi:MAG: GIY-YIG nuclease family protein [Candidatus Omnitrophota bacterium]|jgi:putative endonuclease
MVSGVEPQAVVSKRARKGERVEPACVEGWKMWFVYMLLCKDEAIYTGITDDVDRRLKEHIQGKGGHYTKYNRPTDVLYKERFVNRFDAERREQQIKGWTRAKKIVLIIGNKSELISLSKSRD